MGRVIIKNVKKSICKTVFPETMEPDLGGAIDLKKKTN